MKTSVHCFLIKPHEINIGVNKFYLGEIPYITNETT
jgi:hypothetical protein